MELANLGKKSKTVDGLPAIDAVGAGAEDPKFELHRWTLVFQDEDTESEFQRSKRYYIAVNMAWACLAAAICGLAAPTYVSITRFSNWNLYFYPVFLLLFLIFGGVHYFKIRPLKEPLLPPKDESKLGNLVFGFSIAVNVYTTMYAMGSFYLLLDDGTAVCHGSLGSFYFLALFLPAFYWVLCQYEVLHCALALIGCASVVVILDGVVGNFSFCIVQSPGGLVGCVALLILGIYFYERRDRLAFVQKYKLLHAAEQAAPPLMDLEYAMQVFAGILPNLLNSVSDSSYDIEYARLKNSVTNLRIMTRIFRKKFFVKSAICDFDTLLFDIAADWAPRFESRGIKASFVNITQRALQFECDSVSVRLAIENMLWNVFIYNSRGGTVKLTFDMKANRKGEYLELVVQDTGRGMSEEMMDHLFDLKKQQRLVKLKRARFEQSGLGIALVVSQTIAEYHRGKIYVASQESVGATFTIVLPRFQLTKGGLRDKLAKEDEERVKNIEMQARMEREDDLERETEYADEKQMVEEKKLAAISEGQGDDFVVVDDSMEFDLPAELKGDFEDKNDNALEDSKSLDLADLGNVSDQLGVSKDSLRGHSRVSSRQIRESVLLDLNKTLTEQNSDAPSLDLHKTITMKDLKRSEIVQSEVKDTSQLFAILDINTKARAAVAPEPEKKADVRPSLGGLFSIFGAPEEEKKEEEVKPVPKQLFSIMSDSKAEGKEPQKIMNTVGNAEEIENDFEIRMILADANKTRLEIAEMASNCNWKCHLALSGTELVNLLSKMMKDDPDRKLFPYFDIFIMDVDITGKNVFDCLKWIRAQGIKAPIVVIAHSTTHNARFMALGASSVLVRPFTEFSFKRRLRSIF